MENLTELLEAINLRGSALPERSYNIGEIRLYSGLSPKAGLYSECDCSECGGGDCSDCNCTSSECDDD